MNERLEVIEFAKILEAFLAERNLADAYDFLNLADTVEELMASGIGFKHSVYLTLKFVNRFLLRDSLCIGENHHQSLYVVIEMAKFLNSFGADLSVKNLEKRL
jgi:hypothetical protein